MNAKLLLSVVLTSLAMVTVGCQQEQTTDTASQSSANEPGVDGTKFLLAAEPGEAEDVIRARESAQDDDEVLVLGRIGGSANPWIEGRAAFSIVDSSLKACSDIPGDKCEKPWDYCCETHKLPTATALVQVVDEQGEVVRADARGLLNVEELSTVIVKGRAKRDDAGNLTILASGVYVRP